MAFHGPDGYFSLRTYGEAASAVLDQERVLLKWELQRMADMGPRLEQLCWRMKEGGVFQPLRCLGRIGWAVDGGLATDRRMGNSLAVVAVVAIPSEGEPLGEGCSLLVPHTIGADRVLRAAMAMEEFVTAVQLARRNEGWTLLDGSLRSGFVAAFHGLKSLADKEGDALAEILVPRIAPWVDALEILASEKLPLAAVPKLTSGFGLARWAGLEPALSDRALLSLLMPEGTWTTLHRLEAFFDESSEDVFSGAAEGEGWKLPASLGLPPTLGGTLNAISGVLETGWVRPPVAGVGAVQMETATNLEEALDSLTGQFPTARLQEPLLLVEADRAAKGLCRLIGQGGDGQVPWATPYRTSL